MAKITIKEIDMNIGGQQTQVNEEVRSWHCLSHEILSLILSNLVAKEFVNFRAVCKWWKVTPPPITGRIPTSIAGSSGTQIPFLLFKTRQTFHQLFDPIHVFSSHIKGYELPRIHVRSSNCGWLLVTRGRNQISFINPFTEGKIELPNLEHDNKWPKLTFSSPPTSPDCLVFGFKELSDEITIYTLKPGQLEWTFHTFDNNTGFNLLPCNPILFKGLYYCLGEFGSLLTYDLKKNKYRWVGYPLLHNLFSNCRYYMVESEGKLLLVYHGVETERVNVVRLDLTKTGAWDKISELGNRMLFVSEAASFSVKSAIRGPGNKIYFPRLVGDKVLFFSLDTRRFHCFDGDRSWKNMNGATTSPHSTWIVPSSSDCSSNNLNNYCGFRSEGSSNYVASEQNKLNSGDSVETDVLDS